MHSVQILIADDHAAMRRGLRTILESHPDWRVCAEAADGVEAVAKARQIKPRIAVLDVSMPHMNGLEAARIIQQETPDCQILIVSQNDPALMQRAAADVGAKGFVHKSSVAQELIKAVETIVNDSGVAPLPVTSVYSADLENKLRFDAAMLAAIVASSDDAIVSKNLDGVITTWNQGAEQIFGFTAEEAIGQHITLIIPPDRQEEENDILRRLRRGEKVDHFQTFRRHKDGTALNVSVTISPLKDSAGRVIGASKVARDISKYKRAEQDLRSSEERFRALVNASSYVVYRVSADWKTLRRLDSEGRVPDPGSPINDWLQNIHADDRPSVLDKIQEAIRAKSIFESEHRVLGPDGSIGWTLARAIPVLTPEGEIMEWFGAASDVTRRRQAEEAYRNLVASLDAEVRDRTRELEERNTYVLRQSEQLRDLSQRLLQARDEERRHVARELHDSAGQTLTVLGLNLAQLAEQAQELAPEFTARVKETEQIVQQLHQEIRTTSYLLHPPLLDETGLVSALTWYTEGLAQRSNLAIDLKIPRDFGRVPRDLELVVFRLVQECLTNIHRHSGALGATIQIERRNGDILVDVADNGKGMSQEKLAEVRSGGNGVGLRGIRERIRRFRGEMMIESDSCGTRVLVNLPIPKAQEQSADMIEANLA